MGEHLHLRHISGPLGSRLSDHYGRAKVLRWSAMGSVACYLGLSVMMFVGAPEIALLIMWMPTMILLIGSFSPSSLGPKSAILDGSNTHGIVSTTQAVAATFVWFGLKSSSSTQPTVPMVDFPLGLSGSNGLSQFLSSNLEVNMAKIHLTFAKRISKIQTKLAGMPWGVEPVDKSSRRRLALGTAMAGLIISVALFTGPFVLLNWEETTENWNLLGWNETSLPLRTINTISTGDVMATLIFPQLRVVFSSDSLVLN